MNFDYTFMKMVYFEKIGSSEKMTFLKVVGIGFAKRWLFGKLIQ